jgi:hypothetical protein
MEDQRQKRTREYDISVEYARRYPIAFPDSAQTAADSDVYSSTSSPCVDEYHDRAGASSSDETVARSPQETPFHVSYKKALPLPLTSAGLRAAARELPQGSFKAIETCLRCWFEHRLDDAELTATVRSFAGASRTIREIFTISPQSPTAFESGGRQVLNRASSGGSAACGEQVATAEQLRDLAFTASYSM